jgi:glycosyltransferase involved in cell wall biosynthesis
MRIAIVSDLTKWNWAGCEELWAALAGCALERGHKVSVFLCRPDVPDGKVQPLVDCGLDLHVPGKGAAFIDRTRHLSWKAANMIAPLFPPFKALHDLCPDVVLISAGDAIPSSLFLGDLKRSGALRRPYVIVCHNSYLFGPPVEGAARDAAVRYYQGARRVLFVADRTRRETEHLLAAKLPPSTIVRNPVNISDDRAMPLPEASTVRIACLGRVATHSKGQDVLLAALAGAQLKERDWRLSIYGEGPHMNHLALLAGHYGISDRVAVRGHGRDVRAVWAEHHLLALPSRVESAPLAAVEAMLCGRPSIVNDVGGVTDWIQEPETGFVSPGQNIESFEAALVRAWTARPRWASIGLRAHEKAQSMIDPDPGGTVLALLTQASTENGPGGMAPV